MLDMELILARRLQGNPSNRGHLVRRGATPRAALRAAALGSARRLGAQRMVASTSGFPPWWEAWARGPRQGVESLAQGRCPNPPATHSSRRRGRPAHGPTPSTALLPQRRHLPRRDTRPERLSWARRLHPWGACVG